MYITEVHFASSRRYSVRNRQGRLYIMQYVLLAFRLNNSCLCVRRCKLYVNGLDVKFIKFNLQNVY